MSRAPAPCLVRIICLTHLTPHLASPQLSSGSTLTRLAGAEHFKIKIWINCSANNSTLEPWSLYFPLNNLPSRLRETPSILIRQVSSLLNLGRKQTKILRNILQCCLGNLRRKRFLVGSTNSRNHYVPLSYPVTVTQLN